MVFEVLVGRVIVWLVLLFGIFWKEMKALLVWESGKWDVSFRLIF